MPAAKRGPQVSVQDVMPSETEKWVWLMICDFDVYQGRVNGIRAKSELGLSGDVVMKLVSALPEGQNYADNYFTRVPLVVKLLDRGIHYVGTAKQVRLPNCNLEEEKSLKKKGRGSFDIRVETNHNICAVKWYDSTLLDHSLCRTFNAIKTYVEVERPSIVAAYNKYTGGVDLLDSFTAKYKFPTKSRRWHEYIVWHTIILAVMNAWLLGAGVQSSEDAKAGDPEQDTVSGRSSILSHPGEHNSSENTQERTTIVVDFLNPSTL